MSWWNRGRFLDCSMLRFSLLMEEVGKSAKVYIAGTAWLQSFYLTHTVAEWHPWQYPWNHGGEMPWEPVFDLHSSVFVWRVVEFPPRRAGRKLFGNRETDWEKNKVYFYLFSFSFFLKQKSQSVSQVGKTTWLESVDLVTGSAAAGLERNKVAAANSPSVCLK